MAPAGTSPDERDSRSHSVDGELFAAARRGDVQTLNTLLDRHPERLQAREPPYAWTLLHAAARHLPAVELLLARGLDVNAREEGDNTTAMHWAAAAGELDVVRRLADAGGDVIGRGDDHDLEVIGWATCMGLEEEHARRAIAEFLLQRGASHHIFSAIALDLDAEVRRIIAADRQALHRRMSRNEMLQLPLHFAVRMGRREMVALLLELGADPLGVDAAGYSAPMYATSPDVDLPILEAIRDFTNAELLSAQRGRRQAQLGMTDLLAALALGDHHLAGRVWIENGTEGAPGAPHDGVLHLMAKRGDADGVRWLLERGTRPDGRWSHWDAEVTPLHLAALGGHADVVRLLLGAGADPHLRDSKHDGAPLEWAEFFGHQAIARLLGGNGVTGA